MKVVPPKHHQQFIRAQYIFFGTVILAAFFLVIPVSTALQAGLAAVSLLFFGIPSLLLVILLAMRQSPKLITFVTLLVALFCAVIPQLAFWRAAEQNAATLHFNPAEYLTFAGETNLKPSELVSYKTVGARQLHLAVYNPVVQSRGPAIVMLHGGGWRYGHYRQTGQWPRVFTEAGYKVFSIEYRLSNDTYHSWNDTPTDVHDAVMYIKNNAQSLHVNPDHVVLFGQSAGGHLALLEAYRNRAVDAVIALYAPIDLALDYRTSRDKTAELDFIGGPPGQYPDRYRALSPYTHVNTGTPPTLLIQGKTDNLVDYQNATLLADRLAAHNVSHDVLLLPLTGHSFENQRGGFATQIATQKVLRYLDEKK